MYTRVFWSIILSLHLYFSNSFPVISRRVAIASTTSASSTCYPILPTHYYRNSLTRHQEKSSSSYLVKDSKEELSLKNMVFSLVGATTSALVSLTFMGVLAWKRDALMVSFFLGAISNGILSKILKRIINQTRPPELETVNLSLKPSDGGMPSSHAMSLGFICTFTAVHLPWTRPFLALYTLISLIYRVESKLHTWQQILVGLIVGSWNGFTWYHLCVGDNIWRVNVMDWVSTHILDSNGLLPIPMLLVPALIGMIVVGSFERRISRFLRNIKEA